MVALLRTTFALRRRQQRHPDSIALQRLDGGLCHSSRSRKRPLYLRLPLSGGLSEQISPPGYSNICLYPGRVIMGTWEGAAFPAVNRFRVTHHYSCGVLSLAAQDLRTLNLAVYKRDETMAPGTSVLVYGIHH